MILEIRVYIAVFTLQQYLFFYFPQLATVMFGSQTSLFPSNVRGNINKNYKKQYSNRITLRCTQNSKYARTVNTVSGINSKFSLYIFHIF